jgi:transposase
MQAITTIGLDIVKPVFQVHGVDAEGKLDIRRQLKRRYVLAFFQKLPPRLDAPKADIPLVSQPQAAGTKPRPWGRANSNLRSVRHYRGPPAPAAEADRPPELLCSQSISACCVRSCRRTRGYRFSHPRHLGIRSWQLPPRRSR